LDITHKRDPDTGEILLHPKTGVPMRNKASLAYCKACWEQIGKKLQKALRKPYLNLKKEAHNKKVIARLCKKLKVAAQQQVSDDHIIDVVAKYYNRPRPTKSSETVQMLESFRIAAK